MTSVLNSISDPNNKCMYIKIKINGYLLNGLLDSGADITIVNKTIADQLKLQILEGTRGKIITASNQKIPINKTVKLTFKINEEIMNINAVVIEDLSHEILLGIDFLNEAKFILDPVDNKFYMRLNNEKLSSNKIKLKLMNNDVIEFMCPLKRIKSKNVLKVSQTLNKPEDFVSFSEKIFRIKVAKAVKINPNSSGLIKIKKIPVPEGINCVSHCNYALMGRINCALMQGIMNNKTENIIVTNFGEKPVELAVETILAKAEVIKDSDLVVPKVILKQDRNFGTTKGKNKPKWRCASVIFNESFQEEKRELEVKDSTHKSIQSKSALVLKLFFDTLRNFQIMTQLNEENVNTNDLQFTDSVLNLYVNANKNSCKELIPEHHFNINTELNGFQREQILNVLREYDDVFSHHEFDLGTTNLGTHKIDIGSEKPVNKPPFRASAKERLIIGQHIDNLLKYGLIKPSKSPFNSPIFLIPKKGKDNYRMVVDYRALNNITTPTYFPLPRVTDCVDCLSGSMWFTSLDANQGFYQIDLEECDRQKTAFSCYKGHYEWIKCPMGLSGMPFTFQEVMQKLIGKMNYINAIVYIDDCVLYTKTFEEHVEKLSDLLQYFREANMKLKVSKCYFAQSKLKFLGYIIDREGVKLDKSKVEIINKLPAPHNLKSLRRFLGMIGYYKQFIEGFATIARPLYNLLKKGENFIWSKECEKSFLALKEALIKEPCLAHYSDDGHLYLRTDCSKVAAGVILLQKQKDGSIRPLAFFSRTLKEHQKSYSASELEALAIYLATKQFRQYLHGNKFTIITDHSSLKQIKNINSENTRLKRHSIELSEFDFDVIYSKGSTMADVDYLSRVEVPGINDYDTEEVIKNTDIELIAASAGYLKIEDLENKFLNAQKCDPLCMKTIKYLKAEKGVKLKQHEKAKKNFKIVNGKLFRSCGKGKRSRWCLVIPDSMKLDVFKLYHDDEEGSAHGGIKVSLEMILRNFWRPNLKKEIIEYIRSCPKCQHAKKPKQLAYGVPQSIEFDDIPFRTIFIDIAGPLKKSNTGNNYIIAIVDCNTRYLIAKPIKAQTTEEVIKVLTSVFSVYGVCAKLVSDNGSCFKSSQFQNELKRRGIEHITITPRSPRSNGIVERKFSTLFQSMRCYCNHHSTNWENYLSKIVFALNNRPYEESGFSSAFLLMGYYPRIPFLNLLSLNNNNEGSDDKEKDLMAHWTIARQINKEKVLKAQQRYINKQKNRLKTPFFKVKDLVLYLDPYVSRGDHKKLKEIFSGPYVICKQVGPDSYWIDNSNTKGKIKRVRADMIKPYYGEGGKRHQQILYNIENEVYENMKNPKDKQISKSDTIIKSHIRKEDTQNSNIQNQYKMKPILKSLKTNSNKKRVRFNFGDKTNRKSNRNRTPPKRYSSGNI